MRAVSYGELILVFIVFYVHAAVFNFASNILSGKSLRILWASLFEAVEIVNLTDLKKIVKYVFIFKPLDETVQLVKGDGEVPSQLPG